MPKEVKELHDKNMTYSQSSKEKKHQGADFILENKVKRQKMLASKGIDSEKMWHQVSRSLDDIIKINTSANRKLRIREVDGNRHVDLSSEILRWRALLRHTNYLLKHNGSSNAYSLCGDVLSSDMIDICQNVGDHMGTYYQLMKEEDFVPGGFIPSLNVIPKTELNDLSYDESENEVEDFF